MTISPKFKLIVDLITVITILLNGFIYFYPDLLNPKGQCNWSDAKDLKPKFPILNNIPEKFLQPLLLNVRDLAESQKVNDDIHMLLFGDPQINGNWPNTKYIKRLDNYGNDYYLGHIYNTMSKRLRPSHVTVMGDLFSSQWILDTEFYNRTLRYVERLFPQDYEYKRNVIETHSKHEDYNWNLWLENETKMDPLDRFNSRVYNDVYDWVYQDRKTPNFDNPLFINLTGNHDIGYSGDATWQHMARFHHLFGQNNFVINYNKETERSWRIVVLDSLTLEGPALQNEFLEYTWSFLNHLEKYENPTFNGSTILLTHIPMYKKAGLCRDGPEHKYYKNYTREPYKVGLLRSQNHLSYETTQKVMSIVFTNVNKSGIILTGHDHEGCDDWYNYVDGEWVASKEQSPKNRQSVREIVVRSMMGDFDGQTGILTGKFLNDNWRFDFSYCSFTVQHWWWASKISILITLFLQSLIKLPSFFGLQ
ncbi:uncharacterized protein KGF55_005337 [Candida pseudojiufengensis]|uniref:uncharacterized protein n=1 Tax=Candida pseudojiufengensis TaxID=497109 RepID=UPI00222428F4|nr:uncharacterized protein KGF55_005337 [Candida pseudojiufengensis]KAI5959509.1 hypothetical protein KGF55_005337 [Candida pseudojiufengensis]